MPSAAQSGSISRSSSRRASAEGHLLAPRGFAQGGVGFRSTGEPPRQQGQGSAKRGLDVPDHGEFGGVGAPEVADIGGRVKKVAARRHGRAFGVEDGDEGLAAEHEDGVIGPQ